MRAEAGDVAGPDVAPAESRTSRRTRKQSLGTPPPARPSEPTPSTGIRGDVLGPTTSSRRRQSAIRDQKMPFSQQAALQSMPARYHAQEDTGKSLGLSNPRTYIPNGANASQARQTSRHSMIASAPSSKVDTGQTSGTLEFLPTVNFDDLHASIFSDVSDIDAFPKPGGSTFKHADLHKPSMTFSERANYNISNANPGKYQLSPRTTISNINGRQLDRSQDIGSGVFSSGSLKGRRKSQFPDTLGNTGNNRMPRKSVGPGILASESEANLSSRRQPLGGVFDGPSTSERLLKPSSSMGLSISNDASLKRSQKAKSIQVTPRKSTDHHYSPGINIAQFDLSSGMSMGGRSPGSTNLQQTLTPSSTRRLSIMPNSAHATGLAARTISPTDARRLRRMSMMPNVPPMPNTPPTPLPTTPAPATIPFAPSPSFIPRKSVTPSSSRTTPDPSRKSYSSGISNSTNTSYNTTIVAGAPSRPPPYSSVSRLPTPKARGDTASLGDEEMVPPVPAIPKAYESPKDEHTQAYFSSRKSSLAGELDNTQKNPASGNYPADSEHPETKASSTSQNRYQTQYAEPATERKANNPTANRRNLQPLRLPPLNLLPLSLPTASKIAALYDGPTTSLSGSHTPPPGKADKGTPTTPMTASKASYTRNFYDDAPKTAPVQIRSSSSHNTARSEQFFNRAPSSTSISVPNSAEPLSATSGRTAMSPFVSSSLPKSSGELNHLRREISAPPDAESDQRTNRPVGPRSQKTRKPSRDDGSSLDAASSIDNTSSSFGSSIRRKLSLTRRRSFSKTQASSEKDGETTNKTSKHAEMPPPKLPASATWSSTPVLSPSPNQIVARSRNASSSSTVIHSDPRRDRAWDGLETPKKQAKGMVASVISNTKKGVKPASESVGYQNNLSIKNSAYDIKREDPQLDRDDLAAEEEMKRLASKRKETDNAARELDALTRRACAKDRVSPGSALRVAKLNIFERGEIVDYKDVFFCGTQSARKHVGDLSEQAGNFGYDDDRGDYNIVNGDHLAYRYEVVDLLGKGSFGQVVRCVDHKTGGLVAIKIIRNKKRFHQQALVEVDILQKLRDWDPHNRHSMVNFTQSFYFRGHLCISTELLGMNLYEFIKCHDFRGFSLKLIRRFAKQLLSSLVLLKGHKVIHCDLKPENILLAHPARSEIKVIDFGSSCLENEKVYTYIQSRFYRSPEVILGMTYGMPIDIWSLGCILAELLTGYPIFPGENEQEQLACIMEVFGPPEKHLIEKSTRKKLFFDSLGKPRITVSSKGKRRRPSSKSLQQAIKCEDQPFLDFLTGCLRWDPERRIKPDEAINHEFITGRQSKSIASRPRTAPSNAFATPLKRHNSVSQTTATIRAVPETPATNLKNSSAAAKTRDFSGASITATFNKQAQNHQRRSSTLFNSAQSSALAGAGVATGTKKAVNSTAGSNSALPRMMTSLKSSMATGGTVGRGAGGVDLAAAAAVASLVRKPER